MCLKVNGKKSLKSKPKMPPSTNLPSNKWGYFKGLLYKKIELFYFGRYKDNTYF
jgi:hypothetical protein